jgi:uncharacterized protein (TIGR00369 family)
MPGTVKDPTVFPVPAGYALEPLRSGFSQTVGPWYRLQDAQFVQFAFRADERHINSLGIVHGGMMMSFADTLLGQTHRKVSGRPAVTTRMTVDFIDAARFGDLVEGRGEVTRETRNLVFVRAQVWTSRRTLLTASGVFAFVRDREKKESGG